VLEALPTWFAGHARDLPWRAAGRTAWGVLVSEVMLQQTPVARVLPVWEAWTLRWPDAAATAAEAPGELLRAWGRLGYPRRVLRLQAAARVCQREHRGQLPAELAQLRALPGVGEYTARAVAAFGFGQRHPVVDTNVARVLRRAVAGIDDPRGAGGADRRRLEGLLPEDPATAVAVCAAVMELGALVCTSRAPACRVCPLHQGCRWRAAGSPGWDGPRAAPQSFAGTDRQARGVLLGALRECRAPIPRDELLRRWDTDPTQSARALAALVADGLATVTAGEVALPG
jgi:A/G-specific adenine glycosylase